MSHKAAVVKRTSSSRLKKYLQGAAAGPYTSNKAVVRPSANQLHKSYLLMPYWITALWM
jgi:hypothetical protein